MFIALLKTKTKETAISCKTFNDAWSTLNKLADESSNIVSGEVLREWSGIDGFNVCTLIASIRTIK
jgi:hypothetical protein